MKRLPFSVKDDWLDFWKKEGFEHIQFRQPYWIDNIAYVLTDKELSELERHVENIHQKGHQFFEQALQDMCQRKWFSPAQEQWIRTFSHKQFIERLDFVQHKNTWTLIDWNTQVPYGLYEASVASWLWSERYVPQKNQANMLHPALMQYLSSIRETLPKQQGMDDFLTAQQQIAPVHLFYDRENPILQADANYLMNILMQLDIPVKTFEEDGAHVEDNTVYDTQGLPLKSMLHFAPGEGFFDASLMHAPIFWIQNPKGLVFEHHGFLALLQKQHPELAIAKTRLLHDALDDEWSNPLQKTAWSYFGGGVDDEVVDPVIVQEMLQPTSYQRMFPVLQVWFVGERLAGISFTEDDHPLHQADHYQVLPHYIDET